MESNGQFGESSTGTNMLNPTIVLPFRVPNLIGGLAESKGLAKATASEVAFEFVVKETVFNVFKSAIREIRVPQSEIDLIRLERGWFRDKLRIRFRSIKWLSDLPGCHNGEVTLRVAKRDRQQTEDFVRLLGRLN
jgi:hypothetical protein